MVGDLAEAEEHLMWQLHGDSARLLRRSLLRGRLRLLLRFLSGALLLLLCLLTFHILCNLLAHLQEAAQSARCATCAALRPRPGSLQASEDRTEVQTAAGLCSAWPTAARTRATQPTKKGAEIQASAWSTRAATAAKECRQIDLRRATGAARRSERQASRPRLLGVLCRVSLRLWRPHHKMNRLPVL